MILFEFPGFEYDFPVSGRNVRVSGRNLRISGIFGLQEEIFGFRVDIFGFRVEIFGFRVGQLLSSRDDGLYKQPHAPRSPRGPEYVPSPGSRILGVYRGTSPMRNTQPPRTTVGPQP